MSLNMETVLVVGATGNIGVSAVTAALRSKRNVLAIVRNQDFLVYEDTRVDRHVDILVELSSR